MDIVEQHAITIQGDRVMADFLSIPHIGEVSSEGNIRISFPYDAQLELATKILSGWSHSVAPPEVLEVDSEDSARKLRINTNDIPMLVVVEGERRQRALFAMYLHLQENMPLEEAVVLSSGPDFTKLKKEFLKRRKEIYLQTIRVLSSDDIPGPAEVMLHMYGSNDKAKITEPELARLLMRLLGPRDPDSSIAFPTFGGKLLKDAIQDMCRRYSLLPDRRKLNKAVRFFGCSTELWEATINNSIPLDILSNIAYLGSKVAIQASKSGFLNDAVAKVRHEEEIHWLDQCLQEGAILQYVRRDLATQLARYDGRKKAEADRIVREIEAAEKTTVPLKQKPGVPIEDVLSNPKPAEKETFFERYVDTPHTQSKSQNKVRVKGSGKMIEFFTKDPLPTEITPDQLLAYLEGRYE